MATKEKLLNLYQTYEGRTPADDELKGWEGFVGDDAALAGNKGFAGFTALGTGNVQIKIKNVNGTTAAAEGETATVAHGLTGTKILGATVLVEYASGGYVPPSDISLAGYTFDWSSDGTNFNIINHATNSENILNKTVKILIVYSE